jgi:prevent-host-death family protein
MNNVGIGAEFANLDNSHRGAKIRKREKPSMETFPATRLRNEFSEILSRVAFGNKRIILERYGKELVAIIPIDDLRRLERCECEPDDQVKREGNFDER